MDVKLLILCGAAVVALLLATSCTAPTAGSTAGANASAGSSHADMQFVDCEGANHQLNGKAATFVFWQPWCTACREEAPAAVAASEELVDSMAFYGVVSGPDGSVDEDLMDKSIDELGLSYPQVRDRDLALATRFGITKTPTIVVVGADGKLRYKGSHMPSDWASLK